ncbi:MAG: hypothetical protein E6J90_50510 [Deltaproteobacteria bacterium]|nr:MAG: hypothetical protein E6J90_50510 [Deltaproteobacteria bacterium]
MKVRVDIPVRLVVEPSMLRGAALAELEDVVRAQLADAWRNAQRTLHGDGFRGAPKLLPTSFDWSGPERRRLDEPERRAVEARLRKVIHAAAATELTAGDAPVQHWIVHPGIAFRARFDKFLDFVRPWWVAHYTHRLEVDAGEHYQDVVDGMAWVVDVTETAKRGALVHDLAGIAREALGDGPFLVFRNRGAERTLRGLDPHGLRGLPHMRTEASIDLGRDTFDAGDLLVFCATRLPPPSTRAIAEFGETFEVDVAFNDLLYSAFLDTAAVENQFGAVDWTELMTLYASWRVQVRVLPFTVQRPVWDDLLGDTVTAEIQKREGATRPFTRRLRAAAPDLDLLPGEVADRVRAWATSPRRR